LQKYPLLAADDLIEIGTAAISALCPLDQHLSEINQFPAAIFSKISAAIELVLLLCCGAHRLLKLAGAGHVACRKLSLCPEICKEVVVLLSHSKIYYLGSISKYLTNNIK
jgi:hypothetical protein